MEVTIMFIKENSKRYRILVKKYYPGDNSLQKHAIVNDETRTYMIDDDVKCASRSRKDRRNVVAFAFNEVEAGERDGIFSPSAEEEFFREEPYADLYEALGTLSAYDHLLIRMKYFDNKKLEQMNYELSIPIATLSRHIDKIEKKLRKYLIKKMK